MDKNYQPIQDIYDFCKRNLQGPKNLPDSSSSKYGSNQEVIKRVPIYEYQTGVLWPHIVYRSEEELEEEKFISKGTDISKEEDQVKSKINQRIKNKIERKGALAADEDTINSEEEDLISLAYQRHQSAMGISFRPVEGSNLKISVTAAQYLEEEICEDLKDVPGFKKMYIDKKKAWYRKPVGPKLLDIKYEDFPQNVGDQIRKYVLGDDSNPQLVFILRRLSKSIFTGYLFNEKDGMKDDNKSTGCFFQVEFDIESSKGFLPYVRSNPISKAKGHINEFELLYSDYPSYAVGHGCSPLWNNDSKEISKISAVHIPISEVKPVKASNLIIKDQVVPLSMELMSSEEKKDEIIDLLEIFTETYASWINSQIDTANGIDNSLMKSKAKENLENCTYSLKRMKSGIETLKKDKSTFKAFCLMNRAMLLQQIRYNSPQWVIDEDFQELSPPTIEDKSSWPDWDNDKKVNVRLGNWRPFQLAFILLNINSLNSENVHEMHEEREIVDLIWFPTGGGKTEAYFGLTAFNIFCRKIANPEDCGTSVITRYTFRVLTTQQFERSAALITSCDIVRKENPELLGNHTIDLGLWIGNTASHKDIDKAVEDCKEIAAKDRRRKRIGEHKFPLHSCPNCRVSFFRNKLPRKLGIKNLTGPKRVEYLCPNTMCEFANEKIPVSAIDEELYKKPPTFLIGTVDKFAMISFYNQTRVFFGLGVESLPPDLIIQDELHLISGPLGSIYGTFEKLINELILKASSEQNIRPKIICSTATINSANDQIKKLYPVKNSKNINIFPSNAIKIWDNFFSYIDKEGIGRTYIGVIPPVNTDSVTLKRYYMSSLLQAGKDTKKDTYYTVIDYYSSLKDLGVGYSTATSDVLDQLSGYRKDYKLDDNSERKVSTVVELTGRDPSQSIPQRLDELSVKYTAKNNQAIDICLTTNMFSVGVDISRLGILFLNNQTKTTSEYIQATSRVGRSEPGFVAVQYASSRPRDRSYFEQFQSYHERLYSHVEPTSVTPFSYRVIDKVLPALIVGYIRLIKNYENEEIDYISEDDWIECKKFISQFSQSCDNDSERDYIINKSKKIIDEISYHLENSSYEGFFPKLFNVQQGFKHLIYPETVNLEKSIEHNAYNAPTSMRDVDSESSAKILFQSYESLIDE